MKKNQKGFSLAELLIVLAIISVIAVAGTSIAKQNVEKAFDYYVYTGYRGLVDVLYEAQANSITDEGSIRTLIGDILSCEARDDGFCVAPNNIAYSIETSNVPNSDHGNRYLIKMQIPSINNATKELNFYYPENTEYYPLPIPINLGNNTEAYPNIQNRKDLLPFYIEDGISGQTITNEDGERVFIRREYLSFIDAACRLDTYKNPPNVTINGKSIKLKPADMGINCPAGNVDTTIGVLKVADPRNVF